jgi:protein SCO1/2
MTLARIRLAIVTLAGLAAGALTALAVLPQARERLFSNPNVRVSGEALIGGPFALADHTGRRVTDADFRGRTMLVVFGAASSPDTSAPALQVLTAALRRLGPEADRFAPVFISIDPQHDTPEQIRYYVEGFSPRLAGLTGTRDEIAQVVRAYRLRAPRAASDPAPAADDALGRPNLIYVMGPDGRFRTLLNFTEGSNAIAARLAGLR